MAYQNAYAIADAHEGSGRSAAQGGNKSEMKNKQSPHLCVHQSTSSTSTQVMKSYRVEIPVRTDLGETIILTGSTMPMVTKPVPMIDWTTIKTRWKHLAW